MTMMRELLSDGGMSAPAWAFFSTIAVGVLGILRELVKTRNVTVLRLDATIERLNKSDDRLDKMEDAILYLMQSERQRTIEQDIPGQRKRKPR